MADRSTQVKADILDDPLEVTVVGDGTYAVRIDDSGAYTYVGKAVSGSSTASAVWQIQRLDESSGLVILFADGDTLFNNVWDNRVSLSYS